MTDEQRKWYNRGYTARTRCSWPEHLPPHPPDKTLRQILDASQCLRDKADALQATFDEKDAGITDLRCAIDGYDLAMAALTEWLLQKGAGN